MIPFETGYFYKQAISIVNQLVKCKRSQIPCSKDRDQRRTRSEFRSRECDSGIPFNLGSILCLFTASMALANVTSPQASSRPFLSFTDFLANRGRCRANSLREAALSVTKSCAMANQDHAWARGELPEM